jgi:hypothetical protein
MDARFSESSVEWQARREQRAPGNNTLGRAAGHIGEDEVVWSFFA